MQRSELTAARTIVAAATKGMSLTLTMVMSRFQERKPIKLTLFMARIKAIQTRTVQVEESRSVLALS